MELHCVRRDRDLRVEGRRWMLQRGGFAVAEGDLSRMLGSLVVVVDMLVGYGWQCRSIRLTPCCNFGERDYGLFAI